MSTYPAFHKALVIDPSGELRDFLRFCAARFWPGLQIVSYLCARGPDEKFDLGGFDLIVVEHRLHHPHDQGIAWVRAIRRNLAAPAVVLICGELTEGLRAQAQRVGAAAVLNKSDLSPSRFAECLDRVWGGSPLESRSTPPDTALASSRPTEIPGFRIVRSLATTNRWWAGLAIDESTRRTVALKVARLAEDLDPGLLQRFQREYGILSTLKNANVIRILKQGVVENQVFIAMEYCKGGDLGERIALGIPSRDAVRYLLQIMRGLQAVHARGIVHRDLKPTNLLFREHDTLVLTDFGIERDLCDDPRLTSTTSLVADLNYVSPESIHGGKVDARSDLYGAGIVFYHMLTGTPPYQSATITLMLEAHLNAAIPRLPRRTAALQPLIDGLLQKNPNERFQSAAEVLKGVDWLGTASACSEPA
jgi:hypothetical protein